jgi:aminoglycoside 3-N-acetyltransferase
MKISKTGVTDFFKNAGVAKGDTVFLHSDAFVTAELEGKDINEKAEVLFAGILDAIGEEGTLVVPTFTYSATKGEVYNVEETKSDVGLLTEIFRKRPGVIRTLNPVFSVAVTGAGAKAFADAAIDDSFGENTSFGLLYQLNAWIITLGCSLDRVTFIHYVDQMAKVDYRYFKTFPATIVNGSEMIQEDFRYLVRDLNRKTSVQLDDLRNRLRTEGLLSTAEMGRALLMSVRAKDFFNTAVEMIHQKPNAHIQEGYIK